MLTARSTRVVEARRLLQRKRRDERFLVEGPQAVREARLAGRLLEVYAGAGATGAAADEAAAAAGSGVPVHEIDEAGLRSLAESVTPQGIVGVAAVVGEPLDSVLAGSPRLVVVLAGVADPGNAGAVIRVADAAGADAVIVTSGSVDVHNGKCVRATTGSLFHLPIAVGVPALGLGGILRDAGVQVLAASGDGADDLDEVTDAGGLSAPTAWLLGNEAHGLPSEVLAEADRVVRIPIHGRAESLNLATAAAVCLYASARALRGQNPAVPRPADRSRP